jgi:hypothetical protein
MRDSTSSVTTEWKCHGLAPWIVALAATTAASRKPNAAGWPGGSLRLSLGTRLIPSKEREPPTGKPGESAWGRVGC